MYASSQLSGYLPVNSQEKISASDSTLIEECIDTVATKQLALQVNLYETRLNQPHPWPKVFPNEPIDCEGFAHYIIKGIVSKFEEIEKPNIYRVDLKNKQNHQSYTCYKVWQPWTPWMREENGFWRTVHFFIHLEKSKYLSKNGCGPMRFFNSFEEMLEKDAFPHGYITKDSMPTSNMQEAVIGESLISTIQV